MKNKIIEELTGKSVLILGFGREGRSTLNFIKNNNINCKIAIADMNEIGDDNLYNNNEEIKLHTGEHYLDSMYDYDLVIKSPGISFKGKDYSEIMSKITSQTELFLKYANSKTIGVTGTKGKSTTSSLIFSMLSKKYKTVLVGNIGKPVFEEIDRYEDTDWYVYELSSHQLEYVKYSPHIAILLNMYEEHLDHYNSYEEYKEAKRNIFKNQREHDYYIYNYGMEDVLNNQIILKQKLVKVVRYNKLTQNYTTYTANNMHININNIGYDIGIPENTNILGIHNKYNISVASTVAKILDVDDLSIIEAIKEFKMLPHRLEIIGEYDGVTYVDDSISTIPEATISATNSIENVDTVIIGGMDRGIDYSLLIQYIEEGNINNTILMYESGKKIYDALKSSRAALNISYVEDLESAVKLAVSITRKNKTCILSPAAASYGIFKNFEERGDKFKELVIKYTKC